MQRTAMRRIDPDHSLGRGPQAQEGAGLGAVAVQDVRLQSPDQPLKSRPHLNIRRARFAANGQATNAELEARRDFRQCLLGAFAAGQAVGDDADMVAAVGLAVGEIEDMAEDAADGRTRRVQNTKRLAIDNGHDQNQRSPAGAGVAGVEGSGRWHDGRHAVATGGHAACDRRRDNQRWV